jgi:hypothetical protein
MKSGHYGRPVAVPTCATMWPDGRRRGDRRSLRLHHAIVNSLHCRKLLGLSSDRLSKLACECHDSGLRWLLPFLTTSSSLSKFVVLVVALHKLRAQHAPLACYAPVHRSSPPITHHSPSNRNSPKSVLRAAVSHRVVDRRLQVRSRPPHPRFSTLAC